MQHSESEMWCWFCRFVQMRMMTLCKTCQVFCTTLKMFAKEIYSTRQLKKCSAFTMNERPSLLRHSEIRSQIPKKGVAFAFHKAPHFQNLANRHQHVDQLSLKDAGKWNWRKSVLDFDKDPGKNHWPKVLGQLCWNHGNLQNVSLWKAEENKTATSLTNTVDFKPADKTSRPVV